LHITATGWSGWKLFPEGAGNTSLYRDSQAEEGRVPDSAHYFDHGNRRMRFSVIVPTYNRMATLRQTLASLTTQDYSDFDLVVVDDGSTDGTRAMVAAEFPAVCYKHQDNRGPAAARNTGIRGASGEIIAFTDDDCLPPRNWLARLADGFVRHPGVVGVGGYLEAPSQILATNMLARYESRDEYGARNEEIVGGFECPVGGTNNMAYRRDALLAINGFDETFPYAAGEDTDVKLRLCASGARLLYMPIKVTHLQTYAWDAFRRQQITRGRGVVHFERKHYGGAPTRRRIVLRMFKRMMMFGRDFLLGPNRELAPVRFMARWYDGLGQWYEVRRVN
jgi:glycosyltransferase involved in cell wall biosynthesis